MKTSTFWSKYIIDTNGCWIWQGTQTNTGYGSWHVNYKNWRAHRLAYTLTYGTIPDNMCVCHSCDVKLCINPKHLWVGTQNDNIQDMMIKNRHKARTKNISSKKELDDRDNLIRDLHPRLNWSQGDLGKLFNLRQSVISKILRSDYRRSK